MFGFFSENYLNQKPGTLWNIKKTELAITKKKEHKISSIFELVFNILKNPMRKALWIRVTGISLI